MGRGGAVGVALESVLHGGHWVVFHIVGPHPVIRLLAPLPPEKGKPAAKSLAMKLGRLSRFLWD